jgi:hypothetical protein
MCGCGWLAASILGLCCVGQVSTAAEPPWRSDWEEARKEARVSGKPLFVVFRCQH